MPAASFGKLKVIFAYELNPQHINLLETKNIISTFNWRFRPAFNLRKRLAHVTDSQVAMSVLVEGRTSASTLSSAGARFNALMLAAGCHPYFIYVASAGNPADTPSRWHEV